MTIRILRPDGSWHNVSGSGGSSDTVEFADIEGSPFDNQSLNSALNSKLNKKMGISESGKFLSVNTSGNIVTTEKPQPDVDDTGTLVY